MFATDTHPLAFYASLNSAKLGKRALRLFQDASKAKTVIFIPVPVL